MLLSKSKEEDVEVLSRKFNSKKQKGYSLPQMLTATAVGAVLTGVASTNYWSAVDKSVVMAQLETIDRISEAVNVVLASDEGRTTFLTNEHRELLQGLIPETSDELTYAVRSTWKGLDSENGSNHQYTLSLDVYPSYSGKSAYESATIKNSLTTVSIDGGDKYQVSGAFVEKFPDHTSGYEAKHGETYAVGIRGEGGDPKVGDFVVLKEVSGVKSVVPEVSFTEKSHYDALFLDGVQNDTLAVNSNGMQRISLLAKALDEKIDGGDSGKSGRLHYDDACNDSGANNCYMHIYLYDRGLSYNEDTQDGQNSWHETKFIDDMMRSVPKSTTSQSGQVQTTVVLGKSEVN